MNVILVKLRNKIRHGEEPDNPTLISLWLSFEEDYRDVNTGNSTLEDHYEKQFNLLLETVADELIPVHWRRVCLDNISTRFEESTVHLGDQIGAGYRQEVVVAF